MHFNPGKLRRQCILTGKLKHQEIVVWVCQGWWGLGQYKANKWSKANAKGRRALQMQKVREAAEENHCVEAAGLTYQAQWMQTRHSSNPFPERKSWPVSCCWTFANSKKLEDLGPARTTILQAVLPWIPSLPAVPKPWEKIGTDRGTVRSSSHLKAQSQQTPAITIIIYQLPEGRIQASKAKNISLPSEHENPFIAHQQKIAKYQDLVDEIFCA